MTEIAMPQPIRGLYGITPDWADEDLLAAVRAALEGGLRLLQYRNKHADAATRERQARSLKALCARHGARLIINDDARLAVEVDADGVHIGHGDGDVAAVRALIGQRRLLGVSCYADFARAEAATRVGADYVAFGAVYPSPTKPQAVAAPLELFGRARAAGWTSVAIGGITLANADSVRRAGADALAVITALFQADDVRAAAHAFSRLFDRHVA